MESSRIFVRGLPPTLTEAEFKKHFSAKFPTTDVKHFPHRRIGYVGFKTAEDASKAVKYFNRTFMRMSRIYVEIARPVADAPPRAKREENQDRKLPTLQNENQLKRKRPEEEPQPADPKLQEYLEIMQPPSKPKTSLHNKNASGANMTELNKQTVVAVDEAAHESDDEYQEVRKKPRTEAKPNSSASKEEKTNTPSQENQPPATEIEQVAPNPASGPVSDSDWLKSRTRQLLDLDSDDDDAGGASDSEAEDRRVSGMLSEVKKGKDKSASPEPQELKEPEESQPAQEEAVDAGVEMTEASDTLPNQDSNSGRLFIRNLLYDVAEEDLNKLFAQHGSVIEVHVPINPSSGTGKGFAYVEFASPEEAKDALNKLDGTVFQGRLIHIIPAAPKREQKLDEFAIAKLPLKKQKLLKKKAEAGRSTFNWNALYMNTDAVMSSVADRLGIAKSELLDPTSSDAAVKQAHAETHIIAETKAYFTQNGVDLDAFKKRERGDTTILVKNFSYGTKPDDLKTLFQEFGDVKRLLMPPSGTIAIVEFVQAPQARSAFASLSYRKFKDSILFLEKAPKDLFKSGVPVVVPPVSTVSTKEPALSAADLLQDADATPENVDTATLFIRNLNFDTSTESLTDTFKPLDGFTSAVVRTKPDPKDSTKRLSMGYGFVEFRSKTQAQAALATMQGYNLDGYKLLIKASHKGHDAAEERRRDDKAKKAAAKKTKVIIKNLPFEATKKDVRALFGAYGQLRSVRVPKKFDRSARGFAFAEFTSAREAENAMDALRNTHLLGRKLVLDFAAGESEDAEEELERMQQKMGSQMNKVALHKLTAPGRKKFAVNNEDADQE